MSPKARAGCGNAARPDPWRGLRAIVISTPTQSVRGGIVRHFGTCWRGEDFEDYATSIPVCALARRGSRSFWFLRAMPISVPGLYSNTPRQLKQDPRGVGVGMTIARNPLHGSGRAVLPHPTLASGDDAKSPQGIGMRNARRGQPPLDEPAHPLPGDVPCMTAPRQCAVPEPANLEPEHGDRRAVHGHSVVERVPTHDLTQPCAHHWDRIVQPPPQLGLHLTEWSCPGSVDGELLSRIVTAPSPRGVPR